MWWYYALVAASKKVKIAIGDSTLTQVNTASPNVDRAWLSQYTCSATKTYTQGRVKAASTGNAAGDNWKFLVYADNAGTPGNLLYASASTPNVGGASAITTFVINIALTSGTVYWLGIVSDNFNGNFCTINGGTLDRCETFTFASPANNPIVGGSASQTLIMDAILYV